MNAASYVIRPATAEDCDQIMKLIIELAEYENMQEQVCIDAEADVSPESNGVLAGYCLFYYIYSTWEGRSCYMEDLYVTPAWRACGIGTALWVEVTKIALSKNCSRLHWAVLDWNTPSIELYKRRGGINLTEKEGWHLFRMTRPVMQDFVSQNTYKQVAMQKLDH